MLVAPSKCLQQTIKLNLTGLRIPTGQRQTMASWLFTSVAENLNLGLYCEHIQLAVRGGLELKASKLIVRRSNHSAMLPP